MTQELGPGPSEPYEGDLVPSPAQVPGGPG
jgi:hypothetical protein